MTSARDVIFARQLFLQPMVRGARILELGAIGACGGTSALALHDRGAASVVSVDRDPASAVAAQREHGGPGLRFEPEGLGSLPAARFDLAVVHDPSWIFDEGGLAALRDALAPGGRLVVAVRGSGYSRSCEAGDAAAYARTAALLAAAFPSVEVATQRSIAGWVVSPSARTGTALTVEEGDAGGEEAAYWLFVCGEHDADVWEHALRLQPLRPIVESTSVREVVVLERADALAAGLAEARLESAGLRLRAEELEAETVTLRAAAAADRLRMEELEALVESLRSRQSDDASDELAALEAEVARARAVARQLRLDALDPANDLSFSRDASGRADNDDPVGRRLREAEERAESAILRAREAEERMRAAERRAEAAENARAASSLAARRAEAEAEAVRRSAEGIADAIAKGRPITSR
ncbi:class I SAM-dependent methyltransferase [Vulgatibacter incomptus]|uniref:TolA protein n=1 Tax=Vulgatibacter incomptus TaxID=1391653 RepID=A0A0K1PEI0_9BACT|nr:class I SAM-dependent methyltransferase [Vulgatibacter incomptus]AKU91920.1 TolA protein [Vulgatibacter incomptus]